MLKDIMDPPPEFDNKFDKFKYWFKNVYWYHYKIHTIIGAAIIGLIVWILVSVFSTREPDIVLVTVSQTMLPYEVAETLMNDIAEFAGDINGDGVVLGELVTINFGDVVSLVGNHMLLGAQAQREDIMLFILDEYAYQQVEYGLPLVDLSQYFPGSEKIVDVSDSAKVQELSPDRETVFYACVVQQDADISHVEVPVGAIEHLLK